MTPADRVSTAGIHHVTAIASDPRTNLDFYTDVLGLRLVKRTVNFDDPGTYHLYYGDGGGTPGTILTFFPYPGARRGARGAGQATTTAFSVPEGSLGWWLERLERYGVPRDEPVERFDEEAVTFLDPDGLKLELVAHAGAEEHVPWKHGPVPPERSIRGFHSVALTLRSATPTAELLAEGLGLTADGEAGGRSRFRGTSPVGARVDLIESPGGTAGTVAAGTVHHVAFRVPTEEEQLAWRDRLLDAGLGVTPVQDRQYFRSIYFREPGGVLFEIATDPPGFTADETVEELGSALKLPPWLERHRGEIAAALPSLEHGAGTGQGVA